MPPPLWHSFTLVHSLARTLLLCCYGITGGGVGVGIFPSPFLHKTCFSIGKKKNHQNNFWFASAPMNLTVSLKSSSFCCVCPHFKDKNRKGCFCFLHKDMRFSVRLLSPPGCVSRRVEEIVRRRRRRSRIYARVIQTSLRMMVRRAASDTLSGICDCRLHCHGRLLGCYLGSGRPYRLVLEWVTQIGLRKLGFVEAGIGILYAVLDLPSSSLIAEDTRREQDKN